MNVAPFAFRMRAHAAAHLEFGSTMRIGWPDAVAMMCSEYTGGEAGRAYPVTLFAEIRGEDVSLSAAQSRLARAIGNALALIAVATNSAIADPLAVGAFSLDLGASREFVWYATPPASTFAPPGIRKFEAGPVHDFMLAVGHHSQTELLHRAMESYRRALGAWTPETQLMAGEFLYVAAETLSRCLVEERAHDKGITPKNLAQSEGGISVEHLRARYLRDDVFAGDQTAFDAMKTASDGFEHGYLGVDEVSGHMTGVLEQSMGYVRRALITTARPANGAQAVLLGERYDEPRGLVPMIQFVRGELAVEDTAKPPPDLGLLDIDFALVAPQAREEAGGVKLEYKPELRVSTVPNNLQIRITGAGVRAAYVNQAKISGGEVWSQVECESVGEEDQHTS